MLPELPRKPLHATLAGTTGDRRMNRLKPPRCTACGHDEMFVVVRTECDLYFRCEYCARISTVVKPGRDRFGT